MGSTNCRADVHSIVGLRGADVDAQGGDLPAPVEVHARQLRAPRGERTQQDANHAELRRRSEGNQSHVVNV